MVALEDVKQAVKPRDEDLSWLFQAERGAVAVNHDGSGAYVRGTETIYFVPLPALTCECRGFEIRKRCYHVVRVLEHLREQHPCLFCDGYLVTRLEYHESRGYLLVASCAFEGCSYRKVL